jgi:hypothetical protein
MKYFLAFVMVIGLLLVAQTVKCSSHPEGR